MASAAPDFAPSGLVPSDSAGDAASLPGSEAVAFAVPDAEVIAIRGARVHTLKNVSLDLPRDALVVVTGLSGSGKSSLAFDTVYAEGQRRFMESLSAYARQFLGMMERPDVDHIDGLSPVIAIEQKTVSRNPRSTVGTVTEIYDFLRLLFARAGEAFSYTTGARMRKQSDDEIIDAVAGLPEGTKVILLAPVVKGRKGHYRELFEQIGRQGFERVRVDGALREIADGMKLDRYKTHDIEVVVDRLVVRADAPVAPPAAGGTEAAGTETGGAASGPAAGSAPETASMRSRIAASVETALGLGEGTCIAHLPDGTPDAPAPRDILLSRHLVDPESGLSYDEPSPNTFSFNSPYGACPLCDGLGSRRALDPALLVPDARKTIAQGALAPLGKPRDVWVFSQLRAVADALGFTFDTPIADLTEEQREVLMRGAGDRPFAVTYTYKGRTVTYEHRFTGVEGHVQHTFDNATAPSQRKWAEAFMRRLPCAACGGGRLKPEALSYRVGGHGIADLVQMDLATLREAIGGLVGGHRGEDGAAETEGLGGRQAVIAAPILKEITERLDFMIGVGVEYLTLDRPARTLSGGESQRIRLATQIGTQLTGVLYVLDEPSIGLHPRDNARLIDSLRRLRDLGNSVLVVEHDREMIEAADHVVDLGPGAGEHGGVVVAQGPPSALYGSGDGAPVDRSVDRSQVDGAAGGASVSAGGGDGAAGAAPSASLTAQYLRGERHVPMPTRRHAGSGHALRLAGATGHNLKGDPLTVPLGTLTAVTGVSGSGKSSLVNQTLYPILAGHFHKAQTVPLPYGEIEGLDAIDKVIDIDQSPIGRTPRSNPATYTGLYGHIRDLFALLPESKIRGYKPGRFSFNVKGGRCETCKGAGLMKLEMNFLPDVYVECETCKGRRYNAETLDVRYKGASIADVLDLTVEDALAFFEAVPRIERKLRTLASVGLGYVRLGQQATTLSGGEAQRIKLAKELSRPGTGRTLYILDEPTTGLHFEDVRHLMIVLRALVDKGNTVLVIEHNLDVVKVADHVVDLGPTGGAGGGRILFAGTPEALAAQDTPTARFLRDELARSIYADDETLDLDALASNDPADAADDVVEDDEPDAEDA